MLAVAGQCHHPGQESRLGQSIRGALCCCPGTEHGPSRHHKHAASFGSENTCSPYKLALAMWLGKPGLSPEATSLLHMCRSPYTFR